MRRMLVVGALVLAGLAWAAWRRIEREVGEGKDLHGVAFVGSAACRGCHAGNFASWHRTFHRTMTAEATPASVLGRFDGSIVRHAGVEARMDRDGDAFRMTFTRDGDVRQVRVARTVGSRRVQQYLAKLGDEYWRLPVAWHVEERRWFPMTGAFLFSDDAENPARPGQPVFGGGVFDRHVTRWNDNCIFCHNVAPDPGWRAGGGFQTTTAELGIACEACHGPGAAHARQNADPLRRFVLRARGLADPTIVNPSRLSPARAAEVCGRCHGQRLAADVAPFLAHGDPFVPGDRLARYTTPLQRDTPLAGDARAFAARFWRDGTPRLTAYEYQGLLQSRCAQRGALTCTTCHGMHEGDPRGQLRAAFRGDAADSMCTGCHGALADAPARLEHAQHGARGGGVRCVDCHMPRVVYGVLDVHRSHRIEIPDPAAQAAAGRPDACTGCHVSRTPAWAAAARSRLWNGPAAARAVVGPSPLEALFEGDALTRAVAADALGRAPAPDQAERSARIGALLEAMSADRYPAVRHLAWRAVARLTTDAAPLLRAYDPSADSGGRQPAVARLRDALGVTGGPPRAAGAREPAPALDIGE